MCLAVLASLDVARGDEKLKPEADGLRVGADGGLDRATREALVVLDRLADFLHDVGRAERGRHRLVGCRARTERTFSARTASAVGCACGRHENVRSGLSFFADTPFARFFAASSWPMLSTSTTATPALMSSCT